MFLAEQTAELKDRYQKMLAMLGSLSRLFSDSDEPYIAYRIAENLFCKVFSADNHSRSDVSADASKDRLGFAIKTFIHGNGRTSQKVAEFNSEHGLFSGLAPEEKIRKISELRNKRIEVTKAILGIDDVIYHCITRKTREIWVSETHLHPVSLESISTIKKSGNIINFEDGLGEYSFNIAKSTLYKRFIIDDFLVAAPTEILSDPFSELERLLIGVRGHAQIVAEAHVTLPLFSEKGERNVPTKSGLNQWNAGGRERNADEVYIPIPIWIHKKFPGFFPPRDESFTLKLPSGESLSVSACQDGSKALMSNPNAALGKWLLRDILKVAEGELLTYSKLEELGLDSVKIYKEGSEYKIEFAKIGSYDEFKNTHDV